MRQINEIIIHCSATPEGREHNAADIDKWHKERGWAKIGYHYVILLDGTIEAGRAESEIGSHTFGHNSNSIGICYIGGCDAAMKPKDTRTEVQKKAIVGLVSKLQIAHPKATIHGHNEFANKACPSFDVQKEFNKK